MLTIGEPVSYGHTTHWPVSAGPKGGPMVTVRMGRDGVLACMTCHRIDCRHCAAVADQMEKAPAAA